MQSQWNSKQNCQWIKQVWKGYERSRDILKMVKRIKLATSAGLNVAFSLKLNYTLEINGSANQIGGWWPNTLIAMKLQV